MTRRDRPLKQTIRNAKLLGADVLGIRRRLREGVSTVAREADRFGVGIETIRRANRGETFRHLGRGEVEMTAPLVDEPTEAEIQASQARMARLLASQKAKDPDRMIEEWVGKSPLDEK